MSTQDPQSNPPAYGGGNPGQAQGYGQPQGYAPGPSDYQQQGYHQPGPYGYQQQGYHQPGPYGYQNSSQRVGTHPGVSVGFIDAIKRFYAKYAQFSGRASRSEYWWVALYLVLTYMALSILIAADTDSLGNTGGLGTLMGLLLVVFAVGNLVPSIAIGVRRLHDINISGWLYLIALIPYLGSIVLFVLMLLSPNPAGARFDR